MSTYTCLVCRYPGLSEPPYSDAGPSYEICPSCGFEYGVTDEDTGITPEQWRAEWIDRGAPWSSTSPRPDEWDGLAQLRSS